MSMVELVNLKPDCNLDEVKLLCENAEKYACKGICIPPYYVRTATRLLESSKVRVGTIIGFPMGYEAIASKVEEIKRGVNDEIDEFNIGINHCAIKNNDWTYLKNEIDSITRAAHLRGKIIKIIIDISLLEKDETQKVCNLCGELDVDYVAITGLDNQADLELITFVRKNLTTKVKIKYMGNINSLQEVEKLKSFGVHCLELPLEALSLFEVPLKQ